MITNLKIFNFQSHEQTELSLHPGVNIVVGASDAGKTAIIRALRWVAWNRPSGDSIRSNWGGETSVEIETEEGCVVRTKGKQDAYMLNDHGAEFAFKAFGTSVPEEISKFLNINEINIQEQLDTPFLLGKEFTPGKVAEHFNKVAKLDKIDSSTTFINSAIRQLTSDLKYAEEQESKLTEELKGFEHLEKMEIEIEVLETMENQLQGMKKTRERLMDWCVDYQETDTAIDVESELLQYEKPLNEIFQWKEELDAYETHRDKLNFLLNQIDNVEKNLSDSKIHTALEPLVNSMLELYKEKNTAVEGRNKLFTAIRSISGVEYRLESAKSLYAKLEAKYELEFPVGSICSFCGSKIVR